MSQPQNACSSSVTPTDNDLLLRQVKIAAPCSVQWETMPGGERVRSCAQCNHKVYNLSEISSEAAANLIREAEGRVCVRLYRRADGSVMTRDCPTGLRAIRQRVGRTVAVSFASMFSILGMFSLAERFRAKPEAATTMGAVATAPSTVSTSEPAPVPTMGMMISDEMDAVAPAKTQKADPGYVMGEIPLTTVKAAKRSLPLPMVAPTPDADKTFLPQETEPTEIRNDPFAPLPKEAKRATKLEPNTRP